MNVKCSAVPVRYQSEYLDYLNERAEYLDRIKKTADDYLQSAPEGCLRIKTSGSSAKYYLRESSKDITGRYLRKENKELISGLAQAG